MTHHLSAEKAMPPARVDWLGVVPDEWDVLKFKHLLRERKADKSTDLPAGAISFGEVVEKDMLNEDTLATYQSVLPGEYLINPINLNYDLKSLRVALSNIGVRVSPAYIVLTDLGNANQRYLRWLLYYFDVAHMKTLGAGVRQTITYADIGNCAVALPPRETQEPLASYLDRETARIDAIIEKKTRFIELLKEKRQALITQAVTKGLDPNVPMRDSGVEWIGEVPEGWAVLPLKRLVSTPITDGPHETPVKHDDGIPFVSAEAVRHGKIDFKKIWGHISLADHARYSKKYVPQVGDIYMVKSGATTGVTAIVEDDREFNIWSPLAAIRPNELVEPKFLLAALRSTPFIDGIAINWSYGTQQNIGMKTLSDLPVVVPPIEYQQSILATLDADEFRYERLRDATERSVELLHERRSALITAAVTGQIDLRETA